MRVLRRGCDCVKNREHEKQREFDLTFLLLLLLLGQRTWLYVSFTNISSKFFPNYSLKVDRLFLRGKGIKIGNLYERRLDELQQSDV